MRTISIIPTEKCYKRINYKPWARAPERCWPCGQCWLPRMFPLYPRLGFSVRSNFFFHSMSMIWQFLCWCFPARECVGISQLCQDTTSLGFSWTAIEERCKLFSSQGWIRLERSRGWRAFLLQGAQVDLAQTGLWGCFQNWVSGIVFEASLSAKLDRITSSEL